MGDDEVGRFHECVDLVVDESGDGVDGGKDSVSGVPDGIVEWCFAVVAGEKVVAVVVAELVAVAMVTGRWGAADVGRPGVCICTEIGGCICCWRVSHQGVDGR